MIRLRQMRASEFSDYLAYFIPDYAAEISSNYDVDLQTAHEWAEQEVKADLEQGVDSPGQDLFCVETDGLEEGPVVGYFWCKPEPEGGSVFISDFCILPPHRGKGYAKAALAALETRFADAGHSDIKLRVAADNKRAHQLYLAAGFHETGINMRKPLGNQ
ncbi:MAG: GNAT family N-acetyltransferase [Rhodobacteraceae bacterium]|nr:MAG: GNAT family N-acetyltransferase [Paracoccaceae bacterium]